MSSTDMKADAESMLSKFIERNKHLEWHAELRCDPVAFANLQKKRSVAEYLLSLVRSQEGGAAK